MTKEEELQARINERLRKYKKYGDFSERMESHREKHSARERLMRGEGFRDLLDKHGLDYNHFEEADEEFKHKYNKYREQFYEGYWDTKENHEYYSKPLKERIWL
mmetsp:Transcript_39615/g.29251  ORF Transcript_39615/g.29251 Transcript_39615/m.29251 type:complete len:104 (+) Transcript_39615:134-445(+)|eukprot:CAMPEP_0202963708 /NCGR_PEP_ID=MMETSP1396-20130829/7721_1 /ASSEMBLY_ACC=CAM_ASM_000872 /TAXON_ID= /ORGANISM="Pseudokeronopsis sp., Strain Brazil" /LENGTH=103 /DNA_ID=CAMNT_0049685145 /DNA_START=377 /DNA_END=688 /DNA_ORIENTATION=+